MALLKHTNQAPPGNWKYRQLETGLIITGDSLQDLVSKTIQHRKYKGLSTVDPETVSREIQRQICTRLGEDDCAPEPDADQWVPVPTQRRFTLEDMLAFSRTALEFIKGGGKLVPLAEAQRRRAICAACPINQPASGCKCGTFYRMIDSVIPKERRFEDLQVCQLCACSLKAKVNVPMEVLDTDSRKIEWPVYCWLRKPDA